MIKNFTHLHNHTHFSLLDASSKIDDMVRHVRDMGMSAVGMTDHGNISGAVQFSKHCLNNNVKPVIGCELYISNGPMTTKKRVAGHRNYHHFIVFATNDIGYKNLCKLVSASYRDGFYYKPRVDKDLLLRHNEGLIASSACLASELAYALRHPQEDKAFEEANKVLASVLNIFSNENFYLELQDHGIEEQYLVNLRMFELAKRTGLKTLWTNDCHFLRAEHFGPHKSLKCIGMRGTHAKIEHVYKEDHRMKAAEEMAAIAERYPNALRPLIYESMERTQEIVDQTDFKFDNKTYHFPKVPQKDDKDSVAQLRERAFRGLEDALNKQGHKISSSNVSSEFSSSKNTNQDRGIVPTYTNRLVIELDLIGRMGFADYFLVIADLMDFARENAIPAGPGRGSVGGSLVAYALGITKVDPIKHGLLFERFLNPERISMPDIDLDFSKRRRHELIDYTVKTYGKENVAQIITFGTLKPRVLLNDLGRAYSMSPAECRKLASYIPDTPNKPYDLDRAIKEIPDFQKVIDDSPQVQTIIEHARVLENVNRHAGIHAAGIVITPEPISDYAPLYKKPSEDDLAVGYNMNDLEEIGLVKMDYLGLKTLDLIDDCLKLIKENTGDDIDINDIEMDEPEVYKLFAEGNTKGVFQFESAGMRRDLRKLKPDCFEHIVAMNALYRPGPNDSGMTAEFIARKNGKEGEAFHSAISEVLEPTFGVLVYQEQVIKSAQILAGYSLGRADVLRKAMGKKDPELMKKELTAFVDSAVENGYARSEMQEVAEAIRKFARYGFNKAHAVAYSIIVYQTAWIKTFYPVEFMACLLSNEAEDKKPEKVQEYIADCGKMEIDVRPPDVNYSQKFFTVEEGHIRYGLTAIKGVGEGITEQIISERGSGEYKNLPEFISRVGCPKDTTVALIKAGASESLGGHRALHYNNVQRIIDQNRKSKVAQGQVSLFSLTDDIDEASVMDLDMEPAEPWSTDEYNEHEREVLGLWLTRHPMDPYEEIINEGNYVPLAEMADIPNGETAICFGIITKTERRIYQKTKTMIKITFEDRSGSWTGIMWHELAKIKGNVESGQVVTFKVQARMGRDGERRVGLLDVSERSIPIGGEALNAEESTGNDSGAGLGWN